MTEGSGSSLSTSPLLLDQIINEIPSRISYWDRNQVCLYANAATLRWLEKSKLSVLGRTAKEVFGSPFYEQTLPYLLAATQGLSQNFEREVLLPNGESHFLMATYSPSLVNGQVQGVIINITDVSPLKKMEKELALTKEKVENLAKHDHLTGLPSRNLMNDRIEQALLQAKRTSTEVGFMLFEIEDFKQVRDSLGPEAGALILKYFARRAKALVREMDTLARFGAAEFLLLATQVRDGGDLVTLAERLLDFARQPFVFGVVQIQIGINIGIASFPGAGEAANELLTHAAEALYEAKRQGKNRYIVWNKG